MAYVLLLFVAITTTFLVTHKNNVALVTPPPQQQQLEFDATTFLNYRSAVMAYVASNPGFIGAVPTSSLPNHYPAAFLASAGNYVSPSGASGRVVTSYASLSSGAVYAAMLAAGVDASIGTSTGTGWVSAAPDANKTTTPLNTSVPVGYTVSVTQLGN